MDWQDWDSKSHDQKSQDQDSISMDYVGWRMFSGDDSADDPLFSSSSDAQAPLAPFRATRQPRAPRTPQPIAPQPIAAQPSESQPSAAQSVTGAAAAPSPDAQTQRKPFLRRLLSALLFWRKRA